MISDQMNRWLTLITNLSVLLGLIFVGLEVRNSGQAVEAQTIDSVATGYNEMNSLFLSDPEVARIVYIGLREPERLSDLEIYRFTLAFNTLFNQYRRVHGLYRAGLLSEAQWSLYAPEIANVMSRPASRLHFEQNQPSEPFFSDVMKYQNDASKPATSFFFGRGPLDIP